MPSINSILPLPHIPLQLPHFSAAPECPPLPLSHHYTPWPADAAQWTPPQEYQVSKTHLWYRHPSISPHLSSQWSCSHILPPRPCRGLSGLSFSLLQHLHPGKELVQMSPVLPGGGFVQHDDTARGEQKHFGLLDYRMVEMPEDQNIYIHFFCQIAQAVRMV